MNVKYVKDSQGNMKPFQFLGKCIETLQDSLLKIIKRSILSKYFEPKIHVNYCHDFVSVVLFFYLKLSSIVSSDEIIVKLQHQHHSGYLPSNVHLLMEIIVKHGHRYLFLQHRHKVTIST